MRIAKSSNCIDLKHLDKSAIEIVEHLEDVDLEEKKALRGAIVSEFNAISEYESRIAATEDEFVKKALTDIMHEETIHVGQLMACLFKKDPIMKEFFIKGLREDADNE